MKIKIIKGVVTDNGKDYGTGSLLDTNEKNAARLIRLGYAKEDKGSPGTENSGGEKPEDKEGGGKK